MPTLEHLEHALAAIVRSLAERDTLSDLARQSGHELAPASWALLEHLDARGPLRVSEIAACHGIDISSVSPRLKKLESAGLITRSRVPADGRAFHITITPEGSSALEAMHTARRELIEQAAAGLTTADLTVATQVLSHLAQHLGAAPDPGTDRASA